MDSGERLIRTELVRIPRVRETPGSCAQLAASIQDDGLRRPLVLWKDNTLISGRRRHMAHLLLQRERVQVVYVNTIEDAAKHMLGDNLDDHQATPMKWSDVCRWWELMRRLDEPAAVKRADAARRRGVELRRKTQAGLRKPGRSKGHSEDYVLTVICEPFGISAATAKRIETIHGIGIGTADPEATDEKRALAREVMAELDTGSPVWPAYQRLMGERGPVVTRPKAETPIEPAAAKQQLSAWARSLPQMEGLLAGLTELGPPNPELTWDQVGPIHTRLAAVRRELERMIKQMRESNKS